MRPLCFSPLTAAALLLVLVACGEPAPDGDAGLDVDAYVLPASRLFGPCVDDSQCPGEGAVCRRDEAGYPSGYCTVPCDDRTPCDVFGAYHHCAQRDGETRRFCELRCLNGLDCGRDGYTCTGDLPPSGGICIGACSSDAHCSEGHLCEPYSGRCYPEATVPTGGSITGAECASGDACRSGLCIAAIGADGLPTGYLGGSCVANCILPSGYNSSTFFRGDRLPQGACVGDAVCFPTTSLSEGDLGICLQQCAGDEDCRPGLQCANRFGTSSGTPASFENGVCRPIDCSMDACPSGSTCARVPRADGSISNICAP